MQTRKWFAARYVGSVVIALCGLVVIGFGALAEDVETVGMTTATLPPIKPVLINGSFECDQGFDAVLNDRGETIFVPSGWKVARTTGSPLVHSARIFFEQRQDGNGGCGTEGAHIERIDGRDSVVVRALDLGTPPEPGKPFDVVIYQQVQAVPGGAYSLSGWLLSFCGGSAVPSDCPAGVYIVKALGIDPTGGTDPDARGIVWTENRDNFVDENDNRIGWTNLRTSALAQSTTMTIYARLHSPFRHHGNHGFIDALSLIRAPMVNFVGLPAVVQDRQDVEIAWEGAQTPDVLSIAGGTYELLVDVQYRVAGTDEWQDWVAGASGESSETFVAGCENVTYEFRIRVRSEQPPAPPEGASPNQRYPGVWSAPVQIQFEQVTEPESVEPTGEYRNYLPMIGTHNQISC